MIIRRANGETGARARDCHIAAPRFERSVTRPRASAARASSRSPPLIENLSCAHRRQRPDKRTRGCVAGSGVTPRASDRGAFAACRRLAFCAQFWSSSGAHVTWHGAASADEHTDLLSESPGSLLIKPTLLSQRLHRSTPDTVWLNPKSRFKFIPKLIASRAPKCIKSLGIGRSDRPKND